jgi:hypothetical protein
MAPRKEAAKPPDARARSELRKLRNRLSQKAFRARQNLRIKELESQVASKPVCEIQRVAELEERNRVLFGQLLSCHKKLESMQVTLQGFTESTAALLGMRVRSNSLCSRDSTGIIANYDLNLDHQAEGNNAHFSNMGSATDSGSSIRAEEYSPDSLHRDEEVHDLDMSIDSATIDAPTLDASTVSTGIDDSLTARTHYNVVESSYRENSVARDQGKTATDIISPPNSTNRAILYANGSYRSSSHLYAGHDIVRHLTPYLTTALSFSGLESSSYDFGVARGQLLVKGAHSEVRRTNSAFSDHFNVVEHFLKESWKNSEAILTNLDDW